MRASDGQAGDSFGGPIAVSGTLAVIGASRDDNPGTDEGSVYVFDLGREGLAIPGPSQLVKLRASDGAANKFFGRSIAISGNIIAVGSASDTFALTPPVQSAVYLFNASTFEQLRRITATSGVGTSLAMDDGLALTGVAQGSLSGGDVQLIDTNSGQIVRTFRPIEGITSDFGIDVAIAGDTGLVTGNDNLIVILRGLTRELPVSTLTKIGDVIPGTAGRTLKTLEAYQIMDVLGASPRLLLQGQLNGSERQDRPLGRKRLWARPSSLSKRPSALLSLQRSHRRSAEIPTP